MLKYYIARVSISSDIAEHPSNHSPTQLGPTYKTEGCRWILTYLGIFANPTGTYVLKCLWGVRVRMGREIMFYFHTYRKRKEK